jgi:hypothetical protein
MIGRALVCKAIATDSATLIVGQGSHMLVCCIRPEASFAIEEFTSWLATVCIRNSDRSRRCRVQSITAWALMRRTSFLAAVIVIDAGRIQILCFQYVACVAL